MHDSIVRNALIWKEWIQNRSLIIVSFIIISHQLIIASLKGIYVRVQFVLTGAAMDSSWSLNIARIVDPGGPKEGSFALYGMAVCVALGVLLLGRERQGSIKYLVSTPVSRKDIIITKYILGAGSILVFMAISYLLMVISASLSPADYTILSAFKWTILTTSCFLAIFSLAFFVSTLSNNSLFAIILSFIFLYLPSSLYRLVFSLLIFRLFQYSRELDAQLNLIANYCTIPKYLDGPHHVLGQTISIYYSVESIGLIAISVLFLIVSIYLFNHNSLEKDEMFLFGNTRSIVQAILAFFIGLFIAASTETTKMLFILLTILFIFLTYVLINFLYKLLDHYELTKIINNIRQ